MHGNIGVGELRDFYVVFNFVFDLALIYSNFHWDGRLFEMCAYLRRALNQVFTVL